MKKSQEDNILEHLKQGNRITPLDALYKFGCFRLASRTGCETRFILCSWRDVNLRISLLFSCVLVSSFCSAELIGCSASSKAREINLADTSWINSLLISSSSSSVEVMIGLIGSL